MDSESSATLSAQLDSNRAKERSSNSFERRDPHQPPSYQYAGGSNSALSAMAFEYRLSEMGLD